MEGNNTITLPSETQRLIDIDLVRVVLIIMLVFYHAFCIYSGRWSAIEGFPEIKFYNILDRLSSAFRLDAFVFVSGYIFGYQVRVKGESKLELKSILWSKFKRLILPSMVFSLFYILLLRDITQPVIKTVHEMLEGMGHLWFLPMLFWCFMGIWIIERIRLKSSFVFPFIFMLSLLSFFVSLPLLIIPSLSTFFLISAFPFTFSSFSLVCDMVLK